MQGTFYFKSKSICWICQICWICRFAFFVFVFFLKGVQHVCFLQLCLDGMRQPEGSPSTTDYSDGDESEGWVKTWWNWITLNSTAKLVACLFGIFWKTGVHKTLINTHLSVYHAFWVQNITFFLDFWKRLFLQEAMILLILRRFVGVWHWLGHCLVERWVESWWWPAHFPCDVIWGTKV